MPVGVLHVCDKFGVRGSSIHGVSRLFSWWVPRYDPARFEVSLCGLKHPEPATDWLGAAGWVKDYQSRFTRPVPVDAADGAIVTVTALLIGVLALGEQLTVQRVAAVAAILMGAALILVG